MHVLPCHIPGAITWVKGENGLADRFLPCFRCAYLDLAAATGGIRHFIFQFDGRHFRGIPAPAFPDERAELYHPSVSSTNLVFNLVAIPAASGVTSRKAAWLGR